MTKVNSLRLYKIYIENGNSKAAIDMAKKYPEFKEEKKATPEKTKIKKSK